MEIVVTILGSAIVVGGILFGVGRAYGALTTKVDAFQASLDAHMKREGNDLEDLKSGQGALNLKVGNIEVDVAHMKGRLNELGVPGK